LHGEIWLENNFVGIRVGKKKRYFSDIDEAFENLRREFNKAAKKFWDEINDELEKRRLL
jgi:hypothetical protein